MPDPTNNFRIAELAHAVATRYTPLRRIADFMGQKYAALDDEYEPCSRAAPVAIEDGVGTVTVNGVIDSLWDIDLSNAVMELEDADSIRMVINSPGGSFDEGLAFANEIRVLGKPITTECTALAASAASVLFCAGDERIIHPGAAVMIHRAWAMLMSAGNADEILGDANLLAGALNAADDGLVDYYHARTGKRKSDLKNWVDAETYFVGADAVAKGIATMYAGDSPEQDDDMSSDEPVEDDDEMKSKAKNQTNTRLVAANDGGKI